MNEPTEIRTEIQPDVEIASAVIPVLDLMIGQIVLARGGHRDQYTPIHTKLTTNSEPIAVARAMFGQTGCTCLYLADLDCYEGAKPNRRVYKELLQAGFNLWVDADWLSHDRLDILDEEFATYSIRPIVSTEAMSNEAQFERLGKLVEKAGRPIFSIDAKGESIVTRSEAIAAFSPVELAKRAADHGVESMIYLNLESVGTDRGVQPTIETINQIKTELPGVNLISGGGVRAIDDAIELLEAGCHHVLVASAIHDCKFMPDDVTALNERRLK